MNQRIYSLIWNRSLNQIVVASELARCKSGASAASGGATALRRNLLALALLSAIAVIVPVRAFAGDTSCGGSGQVAGGLNAVSCGVDSNAYGYASVAVGGFAYAKGDTSTAVGRHAYTGNKDAVALGSYAKAKFLDATALGSASYAATDATAAGFGADAQGIGGTALG